MKWYKVLIYLLFYMSSTKKLPFIANSTWFLILGKSKVPTIASDVTAGLQQGHHPQNVPPLVEKIKGFPLKAKSFRNTATYQKLWGRVPSTPPPPPPPCTTVRGMDLRVRVRVTLAVNVILNSIFLIAFPSKRSIPISSPTDTTFRPKHSTGTYLPQLNILVL